MRTAGRELKTLLGHIGSSLPLYVIALFLSIIAGIIEGPVLAHSIAVLVKSIVDLDLALVSRSCALFALAAASLGISLGLSSYLTAKVMESTAFSMRSEVFSGAMRADMKHWNDHRVGDTVSVLTNDVETAKQGIKLFQRMVADLAIIISSTVMIAVWVPEVLMAVAIMGSLSAWISSMLAKPVRSISNLYQMGLEENTAITTEVFGGLAAIKSLSAENTMIDRVSRVIDDQYRIGTRRGNLIGLQQGIANLTQIFSLVALAFVVAVMVLRGKIDLGQAVGVFQLAGAPFGRLARLTTVWTSFQQNLAGAKRVDSSWSIPREKDRAETDTAATPSGDILLQFREVTFSYPAGDTVLEQVSFDVRRGAKVAIQGSSGSGKTTILRLILRFLDPTKGSIRVGGKDIRHMSFRELRQNISYVAQDPFIFPGTIIENILMGNPEATPGEVISAAELANAHEFVGKLPDGYHTRLDEGGGNLSGGQKQRICLARAFLKRADILLLDEPTSSVDTISAALIQDSIDFYSKESAVIMISHNKDAVYDADVVFEVAGGKVTLARQRNGLNSMEAQQKTPKSEVVGG